MEIISFLNLDLDEVTDFLIVPTFQPTTERTELSAKSFHLAHAMSALLLVTKSPSAPMHKDGGGGYPENSSLLISAGGKGKGKTRMVSTHLKTIPFSAGNHHNLCLIIIGHSISMSFRCLIS